MNTLFPTAVWSQSGKSFQRKQWQLVSSLLRRLWQTPTIHRNKHGFLIQVWGGGVVVVGGLQRENKKKHNVWNCFWIEVFYIRKASRPQTRENLFWITGRLQTCNEYISWLMETYLNIISNAADILLPANNSEFPWISSADVIKELHAACVQTVN